MSPKTILFAGCCFVLLLALGQFFVRKKTPANIVLISMLLLCCVWLTHGTWYVLGIAGDYPHANKTYLPLLALSGALWCLYNKCLFDNYQFGARTLLHAIPSVICVLLSIPFYLQSAEFKLQYIEVNVADFTTASIYLATRVAEISAIVYLTITLVFLRGLWQEAQIKFETKSVVKLMMYLTMVAIVVTVMRLVGTVLDYRTFSVFVPCSVIFIEFVVLYCFSHQHPELLSLGFTVPKDRKEKFLGD